ncbi:MAG: hypothetical protein RLZZ283_555 [Candidatus Parcubacteria bacterium]
MNFIQRYQTVFIFIAVVGLLYAGYTYMTAKPADELLSETIVTEAGPDQDLIALLFELKAIRLDSTLFEEPTYQSLVDFGRELVPEQAGRNNPFAPLGTQ